MLALDSWSRGDRALPPQPIRRRCTLKSTVSPGPLTLVAGLGLAAIEGVRFRDGSARAPLPLKLHAGVV